MSLFTKTKVVAPKRSLFNLSFENLLTASIGTIAPFDIEDIVPGDTFKSQAQIFCRTLPLQSPAYSRYNVVTNSFFVPYRIIWEHFQEFITGGVNGDFTKEVPYITPLDLDALTGGVAKASLADYLGLPLFTSSDDDNTKISLLPFLAYHYIWYNYFRDQNFEDFSYLDCSKPFPYTGHLDISDTTVKNTLLELLSLHKRNYLKDYFTSCLPNPQRGQDVHISLENDVPVYAIRNDEGRMDGPLGTVPNSPHTPKHYSFEDLDSGEFAKLYADISSSSVTTINELRTAFQIQRFLERNAVGGSRYVEQILAHFGVRVPDATLQRPLYLNGSMQRIGTSEIPNTTSNDGGDLYGRGSSYGNQCKYRFRSTEHGIIMQLLSVTLVPFYTGGINRKWQNTEPLQFYFPEFAHLGEQEVLNSEVAFAHIQTGATYQNNGTFGYQSRYAEYKTKHNQVHGEFLDSLKYWTATRDFNDTDPQLGPDFLNIAGKEDASAGTITSPFTVTDVEAHNFLFDIFVGTRALRPMPYFSTPI